MTSPVGNRVLASLSEADQATLLRGSNVVTLPANKRLDHPYSLPRYAYFLQSGLASLAISGSSGESVDVGFVGPEGLVSALYLLGPALLPTQCIMRIEGTAICIPFSSLQSEFRRSAELHNRILELAQQQAAMLALMAGCNHLHHAEQRLARLLLMAQDRVDSPVLEFTHDQLAEMLSLQRSTVTVIAHQLQERGIVQYARGRIRIVNRIALESTACNCYREIKDNYAGIPVAKAA